ncbi:hypothetical protein ZHAS_00013399 [Anopheles sinensis]|uniref:Uncharacterized protein n=1 Tax=Anopheles sinensis TaxID=74873 RepID=A0A084W5G8_ANOSI|nr:hypothetical protein ZHAS_00013399 [Anopheles sinensis]
MGGKWLNFIHLGTCGQMDTCEFDANLNCISPTPRELPWFWVEREDRPSVPFGNHLSAGNASRVGYGVGVANGDGRIRKPNSSLWTLFSVCHDRVCA